VNIKLHFNSLTKEGVDTLHVVWITDIFNSYLYLDTIKTKLNLTNFVNKTDGASLRSIIIMPDLWSTYAIVTTYDCQSIIKLIMSQ